MKMIYLVAATLMFLVLCFTPTHWTDVGMGAGIVLQLAFFFNDRSQRND